MSAHTPRPIHALYAIANMVVNEQTNHAQLLALCMAMAKTALAERQEDLIDALQEAAEWLERRPDMTEGDAATSSRIRAALAKAEGRT